MKKRYTCIELCAGGGGTALGLEEAGFSQKAAVEQNSDCCRTLAENRPKWNVVCSSLSDFDANPYENIDLLSAGVPCPPFSVAGKQLGPTDSRDCFPEVLRITEKIMPRAVMFENVPGLLQRRFEPYRDHIVKALNRLGYECKWYRVVSEEHGVPQHRPRAILIGVRDRGEIPDTIPANTSETATVSGTLHDLMGERGWQRLGGWMQMADKVAPTITGGSERHGGPDLGPTRARRAWAAMGVDGMGIANEPPAKDFDGMPRLTLRMVARLQAFPDSWLFHGGKTKQHRQIGNALPPPVAKDIGMFVKMLLE